MQRSAPSAVWYRVRELRPRLRAQARIHRHLYWGQVWYVVQDLASERFLRFSPPAYALLARMDGRRTVEELWDIARVELGEEAPTQPQVLFLLAQLHQADLLQADVTPDVQDALLRHDLRRSRDWQSRYLNPLSIRVSLADPDRWLARALRALGPLIGPLGLALWALVVGAGLVVFGMRFEEFTQGFAERVFSAQNAALLWVLFPFVKICHELGHGLVARRYGGEVHDLGVMLLVFSPVPYVDASCAWAFRSRAQRVAVGAAGMGVEVFIAALAMFVWAAAEPGWLRSAAYNVVLIGGVSTVLFNANPLSRFDGYYILSDWIEIPNLRARSGAYLRYLALRYLFGQRDADAGEAGRGERACLAGFGVASFLYRVLVVFWIAVHMLEMNLLLGGALLVFSSVGWILQPLVRGLGFVLRSPQLAPVRGRALASAGALLGCAILGLGVLPVPLRTIAEGVVWVPEESIVRAPAAGFIGRIATRPGDRVQPGDTLFELRDEPLIAEREIAREHVRELEARRSRARVKDRVETGILGEQLAVARDQLADLEQRSAALALKSAVTGSFVVPRGRTLEGRFVAQGTLLGYVLEPGALTVRAVVEQDRVDLVRQHTRAAWVRLAESFEQPLAASLRRVVPAGRDELPSAALGSAGGGKLSIDPREQSGKRTLERVFEVELELREPTALLHVGGRSHVRFDHGSAPLLSQWYRSLRELFLSRLNV